MAQSINPATDEVIKIYPDHQELEVDKILSEVNMAQIEWRKRSLQERAKFMGKVGETLLHNKEKLAKICTDEMGKLFNESISEIEKCAVTCAYFAENAENFLHEEIIKTEAQESFVSYQPLGVVLAIMPWNFPFWQVIRFAVPALCAGNGAVLKHSYNVPGCAMALEEVFREAGLPQNLFRTLLISSKEVNRIIGHKLVKAVTLTGSTKAGKEVAKKAGEELKKTVLELGGSDPYLILKDANLADAAKALVRGRMINAGQSCISPKRIIVVKDIYHEFIKLVQKEFQTIPAIATMARKDLREDLQAQIDRSVRQGAHCMQGGIIPKGKGAFYPPTLLVEVLPGMTAFTEELFGPVVCLIPAVDEEEAINLANMSQFGLGGGIFSQDIQRARKIATERMEVGGVYINDFLRSDPRLPFGGVKESGYGRELSFLGIKEFVNAKTIYIK